MATDIRVITWYVQAQIHTQPVLQGLHGHIYKNNVCVGHSYGEFNAVWFLLLLYFVHAFIEHALGQTVASHGMSRDPLKSISAFGV